MLGLLHDIGRKFGVKHLGHVCDGWQYMLSLGYDESARICLTHSFNEGTLEEYIGNFDITKEETEEIQQALNKTELDDYDKLIRLCDLMAAAEGVIKMEERMSDIKRRYGLIHSRSGTRIWNLRLILKKNANRIFTIW